MNLKIENNYRGRLPFDADGLVRKLLRTVPNEHLIGLGVIIFVDHIAHKRNKKTGGLYWRKTRQEPAKIEIAFDVIYKDMPRFILCLPFVAKFMIANVLYHEIGHHYQQLIHGVEKINEEKFAEQYKRQLLNSAFFWWRLLFVPISPLIHRLSNKHGKEKKRVNKILDDHPK